MALHFGVGLLPKYPHAQLVQLARQCEEWGFDQIWVPDERFYRECYSTLAAVAMSTRRVRLGTAVTDPYSRHPAMTAAALATVDEISGGRVCLGLGAGVSGFQEMGIERAKPARAIREALEVIRPLLRGERVTVEGEIIQFRGGKLDFAPVRPDIPLYVGGAAPLTLRNAGRRADGVILGDFADRQVVTWALEQVAGGAREAGRDPAGLYKVVWLQTFLSRDGQQARDNARWMVAFVLWGTRAFHDKLGVVLPPELAAAVETMSYHLSPDKAGAVARLVPDNLVRKFALAGTPTEVAEQIRELASCGIDQLAIHPWSFGDVTSEAAIEMYAREVMPALR